MNKSELIENIRRTKSTLAENCWNKGYAENLKEDIKSYEGSLKEINNNKGVT